MPLTWTNANGEIETIQNPVEMFSAFCVRYPDDGTTSFPERVARENTEPPACNQIRDRDIHAAARLGARTNMQGGLEAVLVGHHDAINDQLAAVPSEWRLFQTGPARMSRL